MTERIHITTIILIIIPSLVGFSREKPTFSSPLVNTEEAVQKTATADSMPQAGVKWTLRECIEYARTNNIDVRTTRTSSESAKVDWKESRANVFPSLIFNSDQGWSHQQEEQANGKFKGRGAYTGSYSLSAGMSLYEGGQLKNTTRQRELSTRVAELEVAMAENEIELAVTEAYLQVLYAAESLKTNRQTAETSAAELERGRALLEAGSIARSDVAQLEAQYYESLYQVTTAENTLASARLDLKQLLELEMGAAFEVYFPELGEEDVLAAVPSVAEVYEAALACMPEMIRGRLNVNVAELDEQVAKGGRLPSVGLSASISTNHNSREERTAGKQLNRHLSENVGISISMPIAQNRQAKSAVERARLATETARLEEIQAQKTLLKTVENLQQSAVAAQNRFVAAQNSVKAAEESYRLVREQFNEGMKNTVELLTEKNNYLAAVQEEIQAKFEAILSLKLLNFYRNEPIDL